MSGVLIAGELLHGDTALTGTVPAEWIVAWALPQGAPVESIIVTRTSRTPFQLLAAEDMRRVVERVQVTVRAGSGARRAEIEMLAQRACADRTDQTIAGFSKTSVLLAGGGPDFMNDEASIFLTSFDLRVSFLERA